MMLKEVCDYCMSCITYLQCCAVVELLRSVHVKVQCVGFSGF